MEEMIPCSITDREVFQRVWRRVMEGQDSALCPLETIPPELQGDLSCDCLDALIRQQGGGLPPECQSPAGPERPQEGAPDGETAPEPQTIPELPAEEPPGWESPETEPPALGTALPGADGPDRENDLPQTWEEPQETSDRTGRLRRQVMEALEGWQFYRHLARRAKGTDARVLNGMAGELHRQARKLSAAYFLLTGVRYWPSELLATPAIPSYWGALRSRYQAEQRQESAYRMAADDWDDPGLLELYGELVAACQHRARQLRALLEQGVS